MFLITLLTLIQTATPTITTTTPPFVLPEIFLGTWQGEWFIPLSYYLSPSLAVTFSGYSTSNSPILPLFHLTFFTFFLFLVLILPRYTLLLNPWTVAQQLNILRWNNFTGRLCLRTTYQCCWFYPFRSPTFLCRGGQR